MDHPDVIKIERTGYPFSQKQSISRTDGLGNEVFSGDEILIYNDTFYLVETLSVDAIEILEKHGAVYAIAQ